MTHRLIGAYLRKRGAYNPGTNGNHRKWTYKIGWVGGGGHPFAVAMNDGMILDLTDDFGLGDFVGRHDLVRMTKAELVSFVMTEGDSGNFEPDPADLSGAVDHPAPKAS